VVFQLAVGYYYIAVTTVPVHDNSTIFP
jgi:hypothetical protein